MMLIIIMFVSFDISKEYFLSGFFLVFKYLHRFFLVGMTPSLVMAGTIPNFLGYDKFYPCHSLCNYIIQSFFLTMIFSKNRGRKIKFFKENIRFFISASASSYYLPGFIIMQIQIYLWIKTRQSVKMRVRSKEIWI